MEDGGDILFRQSRIGKHGKPFQMYKLRSMQMGAEKMPVPVDNCEKTSVEMKVKADYRVTGVGRWLRRFSLDELAQLINVFKGDMVIVGPRPHLPSEIERYSGGDSQRLEVFPGITGLWQVSGRSDKNFREQVDLDLNYVANRSVWLDVKIIFKTIPAILLGRGAY
jgi:lipopolysaccharide/colanic/teichoic acid biosynthesis glycosyltransferase